MEMNAEQIIELITEILKSTRLFWRPFATNVRSV